MMKRLVFFLLLASLSCVVFGVHDVPQALSDEPNSAVVRPEFEGWSRPNAALFITGQQAGYIEPCGCTGLDNQKGGLARRATLLNSLREERGWNVVPLDAGNQVRRIGPQAAIKFQESIKSLRRMKYQAVGFGADDMRLSFIDLFQPVIDNFDQDQKSDIFVSANLNLLEYVRPFRVVVHGGIRIGVTTVMSDADLKKIPHSEDEVQRRPAVAAVRNALAGMKAAKCSVTVVMAQMSEQECRELTKQAPGIDILISADGSGEPRFQPERLGETSLIRVGSKGMYAGVVGLYRSSADKPVELRYQRVPLDARFPDMRWVLESMAEYQRVIKERFETLDLRPSPHVRGKFVGSETCGECHSQAYEKWENTPHHHATKSIAEPTERSEIKRHFDPECLSCHVTGWEPQQYRPYLSGYVSLDATPHMTGNGCENCHGPGHKHAAAESGDLDLTDTQITQLRRSMRLELKDAEKKCMECHDLDNSPDFHKPGAFEEYWEQVKHPWRD